MKPMKPNFYIWEKETPNPDNTKKPPQPKGNPQNYYIWEVEPPKNELNTWAMK